MTTPWISQLESFRSSVFRTRLTKGKRFRNIILASFWAVKLFVSPLLYTLDVFRARRVIMIYLSSNYLFFQDISVKKNHFCRNALPSSALLHNRCLCITRGLHFDVENETPVPSLLPLDAREHPSRYWRLPSPVVSYAEVESGLGTSCSSV